MSDDGEYDPDTWYDGLAQRLHEDPEQPCVPHCWVCAEASMFVPPSAGGR